MLNLLLLPIVYYKLNKVYVLKSSGEEIKYYNSWLHYVKKLRLKFRTKSIQ